MLPAPSALARKATPTPQRSRPFPKISNRPLTELVDADLRYNLFALSPETENQHRFQSMTPVEAVIMDRFLGNKPKVQATSPEGSSPTRRSEVSSRPVSPKRKRSMDGPIRAWSTENITEAKSSIMRPSASTSIPPKFTFSRPGEMSAPMDMAELASSPEELTPVPNIQLPAVQQLANASKINMSLPLRSSKFAIMGTMASQQGSGKQGSSTSQPRQICSTEPQAHGTFEEHATPDNDEPPSAPIESSFPFEFAESPIKSYPAPIDTTQEREDDTPTGNPPPAPLTLAFKEKSIKKMRSVHFDIPPTPVDRNEEEDNDDAEFDTFNMESPPMSPVSLSYSCSTQTYSIPSPLERTHFSQVVPIFSEPFDEEFITPIEETVATPVYAPSMMKLFAAEDQQSKAACVNNSRPLSRSNAQRRLTKSLSPLGTERMTEELGQLRVIPRVTEVDGDAKKNPSPFKFCHRQTSIVALSGKDMVLQTFFHRLSA